MALKCSKYIQSKLRKLDREEQLTEIQRIAEQELLRDIRKWALGAYRDREEGREYEKFPTDFLERRELFTNTHCLSR